METPQQQQQEQQGQPEQQLQPQQQVQEQQQQQQQQQQQPLAAAFAAAVQTALLEVFPQTAKWQDVPLGLNDEGRPGMLVLRDGREFLGLSYGCRRAVSGEVVFNTGMVGYPESLTDPSYAGQILALTFPLVGNYGVPADGTDALGLPVDLEGRRVHLEALVTADFVASPLAHWKAQKQLSDWLEEQQVPALWAVDTRALTKHLRESGSMTGKLVALLKEDEEALQQQLATAAAAASEAECASRVSVHPEVLEVLSRADEGDRECLLQLLKEKTARAFRLNAWVVALGDAAMRLPLADPNSRNLVAEVSCKEPQVFVSPVNKEARQVKVLAVDCGMKTNIYRQFLYSEFEGCNIALKVVPWNFDFTKENYDGLFISNGPGDPQKCAETIKHLSEALKQQKPIFGICLGNQLLALAAGAKTYKMKFGNRGMNQPVVDLRTTRCYITAQNHGFAVDTESLPADFVPLFVNANDRSNEGISHRSLPFFSVQFHPEAAGGPTDTFFLFSEFVDTMRRQQQHHLTRCLYTIPYQFPCAFRKVLLLGSGGLSIGQAGEFDYSGSQAIKALRENNIHVVLVNPNIATVQTSKSMANRVYFVPVTPQFVAEILERERPQGILCSFGGQTALNCVLELHRAGLLKKFDCQVLGTPIEAIITTEDRENFAKTLREIGEEVAPSAAAKNVQEALAAAATIGYPVLVRSAFALGGLGSGFAGDEASLRHLCSHAFAHSSQVFVDRSLKGWKEVELEIVRDAKDNCVAVCSMENLDPLGIHTGDSIVVAPCQTLSNQDYYRLRECALKVIRHLGIVGECNIQYALDPHSDKYYIVEVNARLSRSSALASKASGYPLAYIAAKLALGHDLLQLCNEVTKETTACFEPALDYVVTKVPRWDMKKFDEADPFMGSAMKSVGEVMAIGRTFEESFQKALRMVKGEANGFDEKMCPQLAPREGEDAASACERLDQELSQPSAARIWALAEALRRGYTVDRLHELTRIDPWFLSKLHHIDELKRRLATKCLSQFTKADLIYVKKYGFSDRQIAAYSQPEGFGVASKASRISEEDVWRYRKALGVLPRIKQIDTLAAEFPAHTNYLYLTYHGTEDDVDALSNTEITVGQFGSFVASEASTPKNKSPRKQQACGDGNASSLSFERSPLVQPQPGSILSHLCSSRVLLNPRQEDQQASDCYVVLGCGCYCIGSSVEFDWSAVSCISTLRSLGHRAIVVNCNPETVSTDYDISDRLYFEDLTLETVASIWELENPRGVIISVGGQTPNNLCNSLQARSVTIMGTSVSSIDCCEDRHKFSKLCDELQLDQPAWSEFTSFEQAQAFSKKVGFPVLVRPSYVLSGAAMRVVNNDMQLQEFLQVAAVVSGDSPVVISKFVENAKEVEFDSVANRGEILNYAISEHVENAGTHSGDATLILPAQKLYVETIKRVKKTAQKLARALDVSGPFNIQFICKDNEVKLIECNLRASRTFPFISKSFGVDFIEQATKVMVGAPVAVENIHLMDLEFVCVKAPVFSFSRLRGCDPVLGVEMRSTGEVACFGTDKHEAFLKAMVSTGFRLPLKKRTVLLTTGPLWSKVEFYPFAIKLMKLGFTLYATAGTYDFLRKGSEDSSLQQGEDCLGAGDFESDEPWGHLPSRVQMGVISSSQSRAVFQMPNLQNQLILVAKEPSGSQGRPSAKEVIENGTVELVINVPGRKNTKAITTGYLIRRTAIDAGVPLLTDLKVATLFVESMARKISRERQRKRFWEVRAWDEYQP